MHSTPLTRRAVLGGGAGLLMAAVAGPTAPAAAAPTAARQRLVLPAPTGPHAVGTTDLHLLVSHERELMVSLWYPARRSHNPTAPWLAPGAAARFSEDEGLPPQVELPLTHGHRDAPAQPGLGRLPVVLWSHGNDSFRAASTVVVQELASHGYLVVTVDHTGDAYVEFPDGRVLAPLPDGPATQWIAAARVADIRFVLDRLAVMNAGCSPDADGRQLPEGLRGAVDTHRVAIGGYSAGGATVATAMLEDRRLRAGLSLDGAVGGPVVAAGLDRPYLLMTATRADRATDPELAEFWANLRGWKRNVRVAGVTHVSLSDEEALLPQLGLRDDVGATDPLRVLAIQRAYPLAFFDLHLRGRGHLLDGPSTRFPEVTFVP